MPNASPATRFATVIATGFVAFIAGFSVSSASSSPKPTDPIVDPVAWVRTSEAVPAASTEPSHTAQPATFACSPWQVSDVAMEEILVEMQRRGWRAPRQGDAMASLVADGAYGVQASDPFAPMPTGAPAISSTSATPEGFITVLSNEDAGRLEAGDQSVLPSPS